MAASAADVRSILSLPNAPAGTPQAKKLQAPERAKKPEGIPRELYNLIGPSTPTLVAQFTKPRLKQKPNIGGGGKVKWEWRPFRNGARTDDLRLSHWVKSSVPQEAEYPFAKYDVQATAYVYSQDEYSKLLEDPDWTKEETDYLFNLVREYDNRFFVIHDRYEYPKGKQRSLEDLKDRYFSVCRKLIRNRPWPGDEASKSALISTLTYDKEKEKVRKDYVASLENRTPEQIAEEDALYMQLLKLKENERRFKKDRDELLRTLSGIESGLPDIQVDDEGLFIATLDTKKKRKTVAGSVEPQTPITPSSAIALAPPVPKKVSAKSASYDALHCIVRTDVEPTAGTSTKAAHVPVHLRSFKIPQPKAAVSVRVSQILGELGISSTRLVMPTRENIAKFSSVLDATQQLVELKKAHDKHDQDIRLAKSRLAAIRGESPDGEGEGRQTPMDVDENEAEGYVEGRAQSVMSTRSRRQGRRSMSISSVDTANGPNKRQKQR